MLSSPWWEPPASVKIAVGAGMMMNTAATANAGMGGVCVTEEQEQEYTIIVYNVGYIYMRHFVFV